MRSLKKRNCSNSIIWRKLFPLRGWLGFTTSKEAYEKDMLKKFNLPGEKFPLPGRGVAQYLEPIDGGALVESCYIIACNFDDGTKVQKMALLAHECTHVLVHIEKEHKCKFDDEPLAEMMGALFGFCADALEEAGLY